MVIFLVTFLFDYLMKSAVVGIVFFAIMGNEKRLVQSWRIFPLFMFIFLLLDIYDLPAIEAMDISFKIGNPDIAKILHFTGYHSYSEYSFSLSWFKLFSYGLSSFIAYFSGNNIYEKITVRTLTSGSS